VRGFQPSRSRCLKERTCNQYHGFVAVPGGEPRPSVGQVVPVVPNHVCPVVASFEELLVTDTDGTMLERWPVAARGLLS
jgi:D-serine deaminase-like pyridoxal phosphate-dependent protein